MIDENTTAVTYETLADFAPDWIVTPGDTIAELLEERGWTQTEFAQRLGCTLKHVNQLLKGAASITQDTALGLEKVLGSTARFWMGLETQYREQLARQSELDVLQSDIAWLKEIPLKDMLRFGWVQKIESKVLQVRECLKYFSVSSVEAWRRQYQQPVAAYRASDKLIKTPAAVSTWLRQGERLADGIRCAPFNKERFNAALHDIRALTCDLEPKSFLPKLQSLCADAGVAVVVAPAPEGCPVSGATKWLAPDKALIILSVRGKTDDKLWFTFFHEAAHLLKHGKSLIFLDILGEDGLDPKEEAEANAFASDFLLPANHYQKFVTSHQGSQINVQTISTFAKAQGIAPGIVVGRLQFDKLLPYTHFNALKTKYEWLHEKK